MWFWLAHILEHITVKCPASDHSPAACFHTNHCVADWKWVTVWENGKNAFYRIFVALRVIKRYCLILIFNDLIPSIVLQYIAVCWVVTWEVEVCSDKGQKDEVKDPCQWLVTNLCWPSNMSTVAPDAFSYFIICILRSYMLRLSPFFIFYTYSVSSITVF